MSGVSEMKPAVVEPEVEAPKTKALAKRKNGNGDAVVAPQPESQSATLLAMLQTIMTDPSVSIERVNQAFDFYQRMDEAQAKKAFDAAMADAKAEFEPIVKKHAVAFGEGKGKTSYKHEDLADIAAAVNPALGKHGLSYRYRASSNPNEPIKVTCIVSHRQGYSEETTLSAGADNSGGKNSIQATASTLTYLQRYTLRLALGLAAGRDDDGHNADAAPTGTITDEQCQTLLDAIAEAEADTAKFCRFFGIDGAAMLPTSKFNEAMRLLETKRRARK